MYIENSYSLLHKVDAQNPVLADAQAVIQQWHGKRIRRIDRYIQLCVAGGLACAGERKLPSNTGVYLSTRCGAVSTSSQVMHTIESENELPKPLHFVNTLGNSAGFYLTQLLQLTGTALVLSKETLSFEAALLHAMMDINSGLCDYALVGTFDEVALPVDHQLQRLNAAPNAPHLFEGTHWLLLSKSATNTAIGSPVYARSPSELLQKIKWQGSDVQLGFEPCEEERHQLEGQTIEVFQNEALAAGTVPHGAFGAASLLDAAGKNTPLLHINRTEPNHYCGVAINA
ncbi:beta-ketoacyl synthase N-terminal-like domain-containing protein [Gilvimarinus sp. 2_MG-2023]|uniref:beta-ketoacyl synthase N-terminal-like domain-containing protein n=1 Tax=Gilvimarinus sp. 2_MG-2023 TaxID=3062666 RepID=UPI0026E28460|nr:beta-ketoacyl synthase N-terminal-like domain-containing protein [Gilvimarinus sp. 2_MG-2023]MDO6570581.1 beta-ketoacyl synthase N-terminal-like domain-containing protein [Gilvimarinus sp. 2_MG-2023]